MNTTAQSPLTPALSPAAEVWSQVFDLVIFDRHGFHFGNLDKRHRDRYWKLVSEHSHVVNAAVTGLSALPGTAKPFAATRAMSRFVTHEAIPFHALIEPAQDAVRSALAERPGRFVLVVHDWCMFNFNSHESKRDRYVRSHGDDLGYELGTALAVDADDGRPLGPLEFRLRTASGMLSTRVDGAALPPGHVDELEDVMAAAQWWGLGRTPVHVIDREADSVGHYRRWDAAGHRFVVRADHERVVRHGGRECKLADGGRRLGRLVHRRARCGWPARGGDDPGRDRSGAGRRGGGGPAPAGAAPHRRGDGRRPQEAGRGPRAAVAVAAGGDAGGRRGRRRAGGVVAADERRRRGRRCGDDRPVVRLALVDRVVS